MIHLILKNDIGKSKIEALLHFLRSWDIDAELKEITDKGQNKNEEFTLASGIWEDYGIDATQLRKQAWQRNK